MISRSCGAALVPVIAHRPRLHQRWCNAFWTCVISPQRISNGCQDRERCSIPCHAIARGCLKGFACPAQPRRSGRFCVSTTASPWIGGAGPSHWSDPIRCKKFSSISRMTRPSRLIPWVSASTWSKPVILWMPGPRSGSMLRCAKTSQQTRPSTPSWSSCGFMACHRSLPLTAIRAGWAVPVDVTFPQRLCASCSAWAFSLTSAHRIDQTRIATSNGCIAPTSTSACWCIDRQRWSR